MREWLEHQAVGGILEVAEHAAAPGDRRYALPAGHAEVLLDGDSPAYMAAFARMMVGLARPLPSVLEAFRTGGGVPYADYPPDFCEGQGDMNRVAFVTSLGTEWLPSIPSVDARLRADPPARVADVACGTGFSTLEIARAYPGVLVDGLDLDAASIALAQEHLRGSGVEDRVRFAVRDAADRAGAGRYDLVTVFEALHDMARPVEALRAMRGLLAEGGSVVVADERVADAFAAPGDDTERLMYGYSVLHCLPVGDGGAAVGGDGDGDARRHAARLRAGGRVRHRRRAPDRARLLALLPPAPVSDRRRGRPGGRPRARGGRPRARPACGARRSRPSGRPARTCRCRAARASRSRP